MHSPRILHKSLGTGVELRQATKILPGIPWLGYRLELPIHTSTYKDKQEPKRDYNRYWIRRDFQIKWIISCTRFGFKIMLIYSIKCRSICILRPTTEAIFLPLKPIEVPITVEPKGILGMWVAAAVVGVWIGNIIIPDILHMWLRVQWGGSGWLGAMGWEDETNSLES